MVAQGWNIDYLAGLATNQREYSCFGSGKAAGGSEIGLARCWVLRERASARTPPALPPPATCRGRLGEGGPSRVERPPLLIKAGRRHATTTGTGTTRILRTAQWTRASKFCGQVNKGARWMPWHQEPMKDVGGCDKPRGAVNRAVIRGFPNGETRQESCPVTLT